MVIAKNNNMNPGVSIKRNGRSTVNQVENQENNGYIQIPICANNALSYTPRSAKRFKDKRPMFMRIGSMVEKGMSH